MLGSAPLFSSLSRSSFTRALREGDFGIIFDWFVTWFLTGALLVLASVALASGLARGVDGIRITSLAIGFSAAAMVCGWLLGLLFGIPRTFARPGTAKGNEQTGDGSTQNSSTFNPSRVNTNLEDISDWLTKTLVGVGLTQLYFVPHYLWQSAEKLNQHGFHWESYGQLLAIVLFLYFAPSGFWMGYVSTRTILTKLLDTLERATVSQVEAALRSDALQVDITGRHLAPAQQPEVREADSALLSLPITSLTSPRELGAWGAAKARAGDIPSATVALEQALKADPTNQQVRELLGKLYVAQGRSAEAAPLLQGDSEAAILNALYEDSPEGVARAIEIGSRLSARPESNKSLALHVWLACAYGQQYKFANQRGDEILKASAREKVIDEIMRSLQIDEKRAKPWLLTLWKPAPGSPDDDLSSLPADDPALTRLLQS